LEQDKKACSQCKKTKLIAEFYKQGNRYESRCKECKKQARNKSENTGLAISKDNFDYQIVHSVTKKTDLTSSPNPQSPNQKFLQEFMPVLNEGIFYPEKHRLSLGLGDEDVLEITEYLKFFLNKK